jgi:hypothetical protein
MKKLTTFVLLFLSFPAFAGDDDPLAGVRRSLKDDVFVVETSEEDAAESLNRISGNIDRGFSSEDYTYQSEHHYKAGPFGQTAAMDKASNE